MSAPQPTALAQEPEVAVPRPLMAMVELTGRCNMACPVCFARSGRAGKDLPLVEIKRRIALLKKEAGLIPLQLSGGEPSRHPELPEVIGYAKELGFPHIELVTNGIRLGQDSKFLPRLVKAGLAAVYLQFDGVRAATHLAIRGQDMRDTRQQAVAAIRRAGLCCTLAVAVVRGVNDDELGAIVDYALANLDTVRAINFQAAAGLGGRFLQAERAQGYSLFALIEKIEEQCRLAPGGFARDLFGHPDCNAMSLVYRVGEGLEPLFCHLGAEIREDFLKGRRREVILDLFAGKERFFKKYLREPATLVALAGAAKIFGRKPQLLRLLGKPHLLLFAKSCMDGPELDRERLAHCCYGIVGQQGLFSFCTYNNCERAFEAQRG